MNTGGGGRHMHVVRAEERAFFLKLSENAYAAASQWCPARKWEVWCGGGHGRWEVHNVQNRIRTGKWRISWYIGQLHSAVAMV